MRNTDRRVVTGNIDGKSGVQSGGATLAHLPNGLPDAFANAFHFFGAFVLLPRPEEAAQAIFLPTRNDVNVKVRHALADAVVHRNERALGLHGLFDRSGDQLRVAKERLE